MFNLLNSLMEIEALRIMFYHNYRRSKSRDEEDLRSSTAKSEEAREEEAVELVRF